MQMCSIKLEDIYSVQDDLTSPGIVLITDEVSSNSGWLDLHILLMKSIRLYIY